MRRTLQDALAGAELLIADGHHRYETARACRDRRRGRPPLRADAAVLAVRPRAARLPDRLLTGLKNDTGKQLAIRDTLLRDFEVEPLAATSSSSRTRTDVAFGYMDSFHKQPFRVTLKDQSIADAALAGMPDPYRRLDTAVLEAIVLRGALGMSRTTSRTCAGSTTRRTSRTPSSASSRAPPTPVFSCARRARRAGSRGGGSGRVDAPKVDLLLPWRCPRGSSSTRSPDAGRSSEFRPFARTMREVVQVPAVIRLTKELGPEGVTRGPARLRRGSAGRQGC